MNCNQDASSNEAGVEEHVPKPGRSANTKWQVPGEDPLQFFNNWHREGLKPDARKTPGHPLHMPLFEVLLSRRPFPEKQPSIPGIRKCHCCRRNRRAWTLCATGRVACPAVPRSRRWRSLRRKSPAGLRLISPAGLRRISPAGLRRKSPAGLRLISPAGLRRISPAGLRQCHEMDFKGNPVLREGF